MVAPIEIKALTHETHARCHPAVMLLDTVAPPEGGYAGIWKETEMEHGANFESASCLTPPKVAEDPADGRSRAVRPIGSAAKGPGVSRQASRRMSGGGQSTECHAVLHARLTAFAHVHLLTLPAHADADAEC